MAIPLVEDLQADEIKQLKTIIKLQEKQLLLITEEIHDRIDKLEKKFTELKKVPKND